MARKLNGSIADAAARAVSWSSCRTRLAFAQDGTWAAFTGKAEVNGILEDYRIDVDDLAEPGAGSDTFKIATDSYVSSGVLTGGNIQIHK